MSSAVQIIREDLELQMDVSLVSNFFDLLCPLFPIANGYWPDEYMHLIWIQENVRSGDINEAGNLHQYADIFALYLTGKRMISIFYSNCHFMQLFMSTPTIHTPM